MTLTVNGQPRETDARTVADLLEQMGLNKPGVAVELNRQVVPRQALTTTPLNEGDSLEVVTLVGGG